MLAAFSCSSNKISFDVGTDVGEGRGSYNSSKKHPVFSAFPQQLLESIVLRALLSVMRPS